MSYALVNTRAAHLDSLGIYVHMWFVSIVGGSCGICLCIVLYMCSLNVYVVPRIVAIG